MKSVCKGCVKSAVNGGICPDEAEVMAYCPTYVKHYPKRDRTKPLSSSPFKMLKALHITKR